MDDFHNRLFIFLYTRLSTSNHSLFDIKDFYVSILIQYGTKFRMIQGAATLNRERHKKYSTNVCPFIRSTLSYNLINQDSKIDSTCQILNKVNKRESIYK